jgi:hypothetical protein
MVIDRWKASTFVLAGVFAALVAGRQVDAAFAQMKTVPPQGPQKIVSGSPPPKGGPERIGGAPAPEKIGAAPAEPPPEGDKPGDNKKGNPAERAVKLMEAARATLMKMKPDATGRRDRALKHIETASSEAKAIPVENK